MLNQTATYWAKDGEDDFGNTSFSSPQTIECRWEDNSEMFRDDNGNEVMSNAVVYVNKDLELEGYLYLGDNDANDPTTLDNAREIRKFEKMPSVDGSEYQRKAWL